MEDIIEEASYTISLDDMDTLARALAPVFYEHVRVGQEASTMETDCAKIYEEFKRRPDYMFDMMGQAAACMKESLHP